MPVLSTPPFGTGQSFRVSSCQDNIYQIITNNRCCGFRCFASKHLFQKQGPVSKQLRLGQGQQADYRDTTGKRVGKVRKCHQVGRPGHQKPPGPWISIHSCLDRQNEIGNTVDFVNHHPIMTAHETDRVNRGGFKDSGIIQCEKWDTVPRNLPCKRGFARLSRAANHYNPGIG